MKHIFLITTAFMLMTAVCACRSVKYVPVESVRYDSVYFNKIVRDSVYMKDSIFVVKGDTVVEYRYRYIYRDRERVDTVCRINTDSIYVPYPVEKELTHWEQAKLELGGWAFGMAVALVLVVAGWIVFRIR